jgi:predicted O-linked N-acetylglucosamine transferase (SPINDLY family)
MTAKVAEYNRIAASYLQHPPDPRLSVLAIAWYQKSLTVEPNCAETYLALAKAYHQLGQSDQALNSCEKALAIEPESLKARYYHCMLQLPIVYQSLNNRQHYHRELIQLHDTIKRATAISSLVEAIGTVTPFYLIYQGYNDIELQRHYGKLISQIMATCYPQWAQAPQIPPAKTSEPIRVGIVFGHFHQHSVWKVIVKGWISQLNRDRFKLFGYSLGDKQDQETEIARKNLTKFVEGPHSIEKWCQIIRADHPHILIYPEVSMKKLAIQLSALRLAPIQCTTWATYVTSGLPTIDYFLSGTLIEPDDAEQQYTEKLVRLPNLSIHYTPPQIELASLQRQDLGLRSSAVIYLCVQSLFKYLPQYDFIFPRIVQAVGNCQFVFLKHKTSETLTKIFVKRLQRAFSAVELNMADYVVMQPALSDAAYHRLNDLADVFLDSLGTAGTTTTLEAITYNLPIVTLPGEFMRGRVSHGILKQIGVTETIATSVDDYIEIANRLGRDVSWRQKVRKRMAQNKHKVYGDMACIEGLETFLSTVVCDGVQI